MEIENLIAGAPDWAGQTWVQRLDQAASALFLHGCITQAQRTKITHKIERQFRDAIADGRIVERQPKEPAR